MRIRQLGDPILRQVAKPVPGHLVLAESTKALIADMQSILDGIKAISDQNGNALSAPQVGHSIRLIVLRLNNKFVPMINPELSCLSSQQFKFEEECFSFYHLRATVSRHYQADVTYQDEAGQMQKCKLMGDDAALVQHEVDHLDGVLFLDRLEQQQSLASIEYTLQAEPQRLANVRQMIAYMTGSHS